MTDNFTTYIKFCYT